MTDFICKLPKYLSIPYKLYGNSFEGADCYGLLLLFYLEEFGIELERLDVAVTSARDVTIKEYIARHSSDDFVEVDALKFGDAVLMRSDDSDYADHIGIFIGHDSVLHSAERSGGIVTKLPRLDKKIIGFYRYKGML